MEIKIKPGLPCTAPLKMEGFNADPSMWFQNQPCVGAKSWFLAHADDGIIWGRLQDEQLITSNSAFPKISPPLRSITLQQARIFGHDAEVRVWRSGNKFEACCLKDYFKKDAEAYDEDYLLWGTHLDEKINGFTLVSDGNQGLKHAVPFDLDETVFDSNHPYDYKFVTTWIMTKDKPVSP